MPIQYEQYNDSNIHIVCYFSNHIADISFLILFLFLFIKPSKVFLL